MTGRVGPHSSYRLNNRGCVALASTHHITSGHGVLNIVGLFYLDRKDIYRCGRDVPVHDRYHWEKAETAI
jgi:hypothetical protein